MLGDVFDGNGVVVAPPQKEDRALWYEITLAMVAPSPEGDEEGPGLNGIIEQAMTAMRKLDRISSPCNARSGRSITCPLRC